MTVAIRTAGDPAAFTATARQTVRDLDAELPMYRVRTMEEALRRSLAQRATVFVAARDLCRDGARPRARRLVRGDVRTSSRSARARSAFASPLVRGAPTLSVRYCGMDSSLLRPALPLVSRHRSQSSGCSPICSSAYRQTIRRFWPARHYCCSPSPSPPTGFLHAARHASIRCGPCGPTEPKD